jgi:hypothetical protein
MNRAPAPPASVPPPQRDPINRLIVYTLSVLAIIITGVIAFVLPSLSRQADLLTQARQATLLALDVDGTFYARITLTADQGAARATATALVREGLGLPLTETAAFQATLDRVLSGAATATSAVIQQGGTAAAQQTAIAVTQAAETQITAMAAASQTAQAATQIATRENGAQLATLAAQSATLSALETVSAVQQAARLATLAAESTTNAIREQALRNTRPIQPENAAQLREVFGLPHDGAVTALALSPDGGVLAAVSADVVTLWETRTGRARKALRHGGLQINHLVFSPDGRLIVVAGNDGTVWVWEVGAADRPRYILKGHDGPVFRVAFTPDGSLLATGGADKALIWSVGTGQIAASPPSGWAWDVWFSPGGRYLFTAGGDGRVRVWGVPEMR